MVSPQVIKEVRCTLGEVEEVEWKRRKYDFNFFIRVRVALPILKPLQWGGFIAGSDSDHMWVSFKYERLPMFCQYYGILGHDLKHYASHFVAVKNGGVVDSGDATCKSGCSQEHPDLKKNLKFFFFKIFFFILALF